MINRRVLSFNLCHRVGVNSRAATPLFLSSASQWQISLRRGIGMRNNSQLNSFLHREIKSAFKDAGVTPFRWCEEKAAQLRSVDKRYKKQKEWDAIQPWSVSDYRLQQCSPVKENDLIRRRVEEWVSSKKSVRGLWTALGTELDRKPTAVRERFATLFSVRAPPMKFDAYMDRHLTDAIVKGWTFDGQDRQLPYHLIAYAIGREVTATQCRRRWNDYLKYKGTGLRSQVEWTQEEILTLKVQVKSSGPKISWVGIGHELKIIPVVCRSKWQQLQWAEMPVKGKFTPDEDLLIELRVKEWMEKIDRSGLWTALQKELHRPAPAVRRRWNRKSAKAELRIKQTAV